MMYPLIYFKDKRYPEWFTAGRIQDIISTRRESDIPGKLTEIETAVKTGKLNAFGFITYDASSAFDPVHLVKKSGKLPALWFALFRDRTPCSLPEPETPCPQVNTRPGISEKAYIKRIKKIKDEIKKGNTYQVNFTFRLSGRYRDGNPYALFHSVVRHHVTPYAAYIDLGLTAVLSFSPELFFIKEGSRLHSKPMKGTIARGRTKDEDEKNRQALHLSIKNRAENLMILDMVRNDLGRISETGSVSVPEMFSLEAHPTLWQMTSTVMSETKAPLADIFSCLFPCASITGAPKIKTMSIIQRLENHARGLYTGAIGLITPEDYACFNVAIRTAVADKRKKTIEYCVGSGIIWDSLPLDEYNECLLKAKIITERYPEFDIIETMLHTRKEGFHLLNEHVNRMERSALYFNFNWNRKALVENLMQVTFPRPRTRVRVVLKRNGTFTIDPKPIDSPTGKKINLALAQEPVDAGCLFLYHKTTHRPYYGEAVSRPPGCDDWIFFNEKNEITECSIYNIVIEKNGEFLTPPVHCGLLPGVERENLLKTGKIREQIITRDALFHADRIFVINSVRLWQNAILQEN
ncbi:MAG: aminodeoxychorismate synthase component I [Spirochaetales bacterium]|nr:aminodeoxychorismate synthase component I [Spirochaetales bacterium]